MQTSQKQPLDAMAPVQQGSNTGYRRLPHARADMQVNVFPHNTRATLDQHCVNAHFVYCTLPPLLPFPSMTHTHTQTNPHPLTQFSLPSAHTLSLCALHRPVCLDFTSRSIHLFGDSRFGDRRGRAICEPKAPTTADWAECNGCRRTFSLLLNPSSSSEAVPFRFFFLYRPFTFPCTCVRVWMCARVCAGARPHR